MFVEVATCAREYTVACLKFRSHWQIVQTQVFNKLRLPWKHRPYSLQCSIKYFFKQLLFKSIVFGNFNRVGFTIHVKDNWMLWKDYRIKNHTAENCYFHMKTKFLRNIIVGPLHSCSISEVKPWNILSQNDFQWLEIRDQLHCWFQFFLNIEI